MADLQKTIKGLRCHSEPKFGPDEYFCETCPYDEATCGLDVPNDALSLLKAQEPVEPRLLTAEEVQHLPDKKVICVEQLLSREDEERGYITGMAWGIVCNRTNAPDGGLSLLDGQADGRAVEGCEVGWINWKGKRRAGGYYPPLRRTRKP